MYVIFLFCFLGLYISIMFRGAAAAWLLISFLHLEWPHYDRFSGAVVITYCMSILLDGLREVFVILNMFSLSLCCGAKYCLGTISYIQVCCCCCSVYWQPCFLNTLI